MSVPIKAFLFVRPVLTRNGGVRYRAEWVARGTGTELYVSKTVDTREQAEALALAYVKRAAWIENTTGAR